jgi:hypothetical protein
VVSGYEQKRLADLSSLGVKSADKERNIEGIVLQVQKKEGSCDWIISISLVYLIGWCIGLGLIR